VGIAKFDDGIIDNTKFEKAGPVACWMWFCSVLTARRGLTDGFISKLKVQTLVPGLSNPYKYAALLVKAGLWDEAIGGYQVHDYLHWNPSKLQVEDYRNTDKVRKQDARSRKGVSTVDTARNPTGIQTVSMPPRPTRACAESSSESKSTSELGVVEGESAREETDEPPTGGIEPAWNHRGGSRSGGLVGDHRRCFSGPGAANACGRGLCIPHWLGQKWQQQYGGQDARADQEIAAFIIAELAKLPATGPIGDHKNFWENAWKAAHPAYAPVTNEGKGKRAVNAFKIAGDVLARSGGDQ
jgi:hypothetical protein